ncbi:GDSL family lipase [Chitinophaga silvatica]|uniref:GDSL family lipase n=2 Tax=Chitinophaga silvatica TaxID=2282649 RepID=A0A3E1Y9J3_9BACT|nr:GDSL family lipase [Chitinophaga silvatica]
MCCLLVTGSFAQTYPRFEEDIRTIRNYDKIYAAPNKPILFIGSSSIRKWDDLERNFASYVVLNRGFGGAVTEDVIHYADDIIFPYNPRQIVIYVGENDLVEETATADTIFNRFKVLYTIIREKLPAIPIVYISIKPSPSRATFFEKAKAANLLISDYLKTQQRVVFVDIYPKMLDKNGNPRTELFLQDMLHMNKSGYAIWEKAIKPYLLKRQKVFLPEM